MIPDPSNPQSFNRYSYVLNNPLRYTDPSGHVPELWKAGIGDISIPGSMYTSTLIEGRYVIGIIGYQTHTYKHTYYTEIRTGDNFPYYVKHTTTVKVKVPIYGVINILGVVGGVNYSIPWEDIYTRAAEEVEEATISARNRALLKELRLLNYMYPPEFKSILPGGGYVNTSTFPSDFWSSIGSLSAQILDRTRLRNVRLNVSIKKGLLKIRYYKFGLRGVPPKGVWRIPITGFINFGLTGWSGIEAVSSFSKGETSLGILYSIDTAFGIASFYPPTAPLSFGYFGVRACFSIYYSMVLDPIFSYNEVDVGASLEELRKENIFSFTGPYPFGVR